jgi:hypothetical protein
MACPTPEEEEKQCYKNFQWSDFVTLREVIQVDCPPKKVLTHCLNPFFRVGFTGFH